MTLRVQTTKAKAREAASGSRARTLADLRARPGTRSSDRPRVPVVIVSSYPTCAQLWLCLRWFLPLLRLVLSAAASWRHSGPR